MHVHVESWRLQIEWPDAPLPCPGPGKPAGGPGSWGAPVPPPTPTSHLFQLFEIVCLKVKVQFSNKLCWLSGKKNPIKWRFYNNVSIKEYFHEAQLSLFKNQTPPQIKTVSHLKNINICLKEGVKNK